MGNLTMKCRMVLKEVSALRISGQFFRHHPSLLCLLPLLFILYKYFFNWFTLLVATSPIFIFTGFFLGIILAYGEPNNPENGHVYKKIQKAQTWNIHYTGKSVGGVSLPRIPCTEERTDKHINCEINTRKESHGRCSSSESGSGASDGSETDTSPRLHVFHQLRSAASSSGSSQDGYSNDSSIDDETYNQEGNDDNEHEKKGAKVVAWTADDQKNILKIGCLEIERNQRLETLIARHRARKYVDRNLMDFDSSDSLPTVEELSKFNVQIPAVFAPRQNIFDVDNFPGSALSALLKMRNTFDLLHEHEDESSSTKGANSNNLNPIPVAPQPQRNAMFRRHESFTEGAPFLRDFWQDSQHSRFRPYFATEKMTTEGIMAPSLEGETSEKSQDSDSTSSGSDHESMKGLLEDASSQGQEPSSNQTDTWDYDRSLPREHINDWEEAQDSANLNFSHRSPFEEISVMEHPQEMARTGNIFHHMSPHSHDIDAASSSTEANDIFELDGTELPGKVAKTVDDTHIANPIYDSSPSGGEKPASIVSAMDAVLLQEGDVGTSDAEASFEDKVSLLSRAEVPSSETASTSLASVEEIEIREKRTSETREHGIVHHDGVHQDLCSRPSSVGY